MQWRHEDDWRQGTAFVAGHNSGEEWAWRIGTVATGRQRVFHCYFVEMSEPAGRVFRGEDRHCLRDALDDLDGRMADHGLTPSVAGLSSRWAESGLSFNSGFGWWEGHDKPVFIMAAPLPSVPDERDHLVDKWIDEAVSQMFRN